MPQRRTPKDRERRADLAAQAADIWPDPPSDPAGPAPLPIDIETMRSRARRLLPEDADLPSVDEGELETLTLEMRGYLMLVIPQVEIAAGRLPEDDIPRACALACVGEAHTRLGLDPGPNLSAGIAHVQRLARSVDSLCDHIENLGAALSLTTEVTERWHDAGSGPGSKVRVHVCVEGDPDAAYQRILDHGMTCEDCRALDEGGRASTECGTARRLRLAWRMAQQQLAQRT